MYKCFGGVCNFLGSVSSQQKFEAMDGPVLQPRVVSQMDQCYCSVVAQFKCWASVTAWLQVSFIWQAKENASLRHEGGPTQKTLGEEKNLLHPCLILTPFYVFVFVFLLPLSLPYVNWASQEGCLF